MGFDSHRELFARAVLLLCGIMIGACMGECTLRALWPDSRLYCAHRPHLRIVFKPSPGLMPGVTGTSRFEINSRGIRGDEFSPGQTYRILALGGSTTECNYLDQDETWTSLLQCRLNDATGKQTVWVGNAARGGISTRHHIVQAKYFLRQYPCIDVLLLLVGINDLSRRLAEDTFYDPHFMEQAGCEDELLCEAFSVQPAGCNVGLPYYKRTAVWHAVRKLTYVVSTPHYVRDIEGKHIIEWREHRRNAVSVRDTLPDMQPALEEYARNINTLIDIAAERSVRVVFITQPVLWDPSLTEALSTLLWFGGVGRFSPGIEREYYSVEALAACMEMYNDALRKTCRARNVECFDLASCLARDTTVFYDDCHFNERGAEKVAGALAQYLLEREPFGSIPVKQCSIVSAPHTQ